MNFKEEKINDELTEELKLLRFKSKLSQEDVAKMLKISRNSYNNYENNPLKITLEILLKLSEILGYDLYNFFYTICCTQQQNNELTQELDELSEELDKEEN